MTKLGGHLGWLQIDHTNSPGIPAHLAPQIEAMGGVPVPGNVMAEVDTWTCKHCSSIVIKRPDRTRPREVCRNCMAVVCDRCVMWCEPFEKIAEAIVEGKFHRLNPDNPLLVPLTS